MQVVRLVDALAVRIAGSVECRKMDLQLEELNRQISHVEVQLAPNRVQGLKHQVETVVAAIDTMVRCAFPSPATKHTIQAVRGLRGSSRGSCQSCLYILIMMLRSLPTYLVPRVFAQWRHRRRCRVHWPWRAVVSLSIRLCHPRR